MKRVVVKLTWLKARWFLRLNIRKVLNAFVWIAQESVRVDRLAARFFSLDRQRSRRHSGSTFPSFQEAVFGRCRLPAAERLPWRRFDKKEMIEFLHWFCRLSFRNNRKRARSGVLRVVNWSVCLRVGGIAVVAADHARRMRLERVTAVLGHLRGAKRRWVGGAGRSDAFEVILGAGRLAFDKRLITTLKNNLIPTKKWIIMSI